MRWKALKTTDLTHKRGKRENEDVTFDMNIKPSSDVLGWFFWNLTYMGPNLEVS